MDDLHPEIVTPKTTTTFRIQFSYIELQKNTQRSRGRPETDTLQASHNKSQNMFTFLRLCYCCLVLLSSLSPSYSFQRAHTNKKEIDNYNRIKKHQHTYTVQLCLYTAQCSALNEVLTQELQRSSEHHSPSSLYPLLVTSEESAIRWLS